MKSSIAVLSAALAACVFVPAATAAPPDRGTNEDFSALSKAATELLLGRDPAGFAAAVSPTAGDWQSVRSTNAAGSGGEFDFKEWSKSQIEENERAAKQILAKADSLHVDFSKGGLKAKVVPKQQLGSTRYPGMAELPWADKVEIILAPEPDTNAPGGGAFTLVLRSLMKFPGGWRCTGGAQWISFPANVADAKTLRELALLNKVAAYKGITSEDDPALLKLGDALVHFIRQRDAVIFKNDALVTSDLIWSAYQSSGRKGPSRKELDAHMHDEEKIQMAGAGAVLQQMEDAGIDLKDADIQIKEAAVEQAQSQGAAGSLAGLMGMRFKLVLTVKSGGKAKNGTSLSGEYVLAANQIMRFTEDWRVGQNIHWKQLPEGMVDDKTAAAMKFENYVAEHGTLPPRTPAPEIEFTTLDGEKKMKLSDLRGKVVVLDFWATWCGPCKEPMAHLQTLRQAHPGWKERVAIIPLSIDDTLKVVRAHVDKRGWTNTFNAWAEDGGWHSKPATAFRVHGVPTTYIIDSQGQIVKAGHPAAMDIGSEVDALLPGGRSVE